MNKIQTHNQARESQNLKKLTLSINSYYDPNLCIKGASVIPTKCKCLSLKSLKNFIKFQLKLHLVAELSNLPTLQGRPPVLCRISNGMVSRTLVGARPSEYLYQYKTFDISIITNHH